MAGFPQECLGINMPSEDDILNALKAVKYPGYSRDIVSFGIVTDVAVAARELEGTMKVKLREKIQKAEQKLRAGISTAETTREWARLAAHVDTLVADEVLRESCGDAVESAENLVRTLRAEEKEHKAVAKVCKIVLRVLYRHVRYFCRSVTRHHIPTCRAMMYIAIT